MASAAIARLAAAERYARMRREARAGIVDGLFARSEVAASPNLRWLDTGARFDALAQPSPCRLPPITPRRPPKRLQEGDVCPVCLGNFAEDTHGGEATCVQWTACCGRAFHAGCIAKCGTQCPWCRTTIGKGAQREALQALSPATPLRSALRLEPLGDRGAPG